MKLKGRVSVACVASILMCGCGLGGHWKYNGEAGMGRLSPFPNQSAIAYSVSTSGLSHIYAVSWDGSTTRQLTRDAHADSDVCVSPDGKFIVFVRQNGANVHLWRMNTDGTGQRQLTFGPECETEPSIAPDGGQIAYVLSEPRSGSAYTLGVMKSNGTHLRILTPVSIDTQDTTPVFDPTGTRIYFSRYSFNGPGRMEVWAVNVDGKGERCVGYGNHPAVSPDGMKIAFFDEPQNETLGIMNSNGTERAIIGRDINYGTCVRYSPDGSNLLVDGGTSSTNTLWAISTTAGNRRVVKTIP